MTIGAILGSIELGMIYGVLALGVFLSFRTLNMPDLTVDGSVVTGASISAMFVSTGGNPVLALFLAGLGGSIAGVITALLNTKLKIQPLLAGILVMLSLYSINLRIMGNKSNIPLNNSNTIYRLGKETVLGEYYSLTIGFAIITLIVLLLFLFLKTRIGFVLRATGDNEEMVRASGYNSDNMKLIGMGISNGLVGLAGGLLCQYQSFADANMGTGMVVIGLASVIIGEVIFGTKSLPRRLIAVVLGAILYRVIIAMALSLGMPANDLKLVSAVIVTLALSLGILSKKKAGVKNA
ncbi:MAG: ABC transporter permease [Eubacteriales bacterium]|nr:ABC transporter permease [Eubacteriales bacterium]